MCADSTVEAWNNGGDLNLQEALAGPEKERWLSGIREELDCFSENNA